MKLKKSIKRKIMIALTLIVIVVIGVVIVLNLPKKENDKVEEVKVVNEVEKYGYQLKETKSKKYKKMFEELKEILSEETLDEQKYLFMIFIH